MTFQYTTAALAVLLAFSTLWMEDRNRRNVMQPAYASAQASRTVAPGFVAAFGTSGALRNLLF